MPTYFRAVAVDYDGTLTTGPRPEAAVLSALRDVRANGRKILLVTGRILSELRSDFPEVDDHFDAIVAENGAVLSVPGIGTRLLADPVPAALYDVLSRRSVPVRQGEVLLAGEAVHDTVVLHEIGRLGLDCQILHNRGALMVLPAGVSKGSGLFQALGDLGVSYHSSIAIGDAENDHSLLDACEVGVATANAIGSLKAHADVVLSEPNGAGIARFLRGPILEGVIGVEPRRWRIEIGTSADGLPVTIPGSRVNLLITGETGTGKSYFAGLVAEQLIKMGYTLCVLDLEGDHVGLANVRGVMVVGGREPLPSPDQLGKLLRHRFGSVVVDLSLEDEAKKRDYSRAALQHLQQLRQETGLPHWIVVEEAHVCLASSQEGEPWLDIDQTGLCMVTYQPQQLSGRTISGADLLISLEAKHATMRHSGRPEIETFSLGHRSTTHLRHLHKYSEFLLPEHRRFFFRDAHSPAGLVAGNLAEFDDQLRRVAEGVLRHHAHGRDFSRWIRDVFRDSRLAHDIRIIEEKLASAPAARSIESLRDEMIQTIEKRFQSNPAPSDDVHAALSSRDLTAAT